MRKFLALLLALALTLSVMAVFAADGLYISVISKGEQHAFWQAVRKGVEDAAKEYGVDLLLLWTSQEQDIQLQVEELKAELSRGPNALCLAALDTSSVMTELQECIDKTSPSSALTPACRMRPKVPSRPLLPPTRMLVLWPQKN